MQGRTGNTEKKRQSGYMLGDPGHDTCWGLPCNDSPRKTIWGTFGTACTHSDKVGRAKALLWMSGSTPCLLWS